MKLVFIHGSGAIGEVWYYQKKRFTQADAPDLPGHPDGNPCNSVEEYSDWLHAYFKQRGYKDVVLAGHSLGGGITLQHAIKYPDDLKAIILVGSGARLKVLPLTLELIREKLSDAEGWLNELVSPLYSGVGEEARNIVLPLLARLGPMPQLQDLLCCDKFDVMDKVVTISLPALAIVGDQDNMTPPKYSQYMAKNMPSCQVELIEGGTHLAFLEKPDLVNGAIENFLNGIG